MTSWLAKTAERQRQREERRRERIARKKAQLEEGPRHKFTDANYDLQKSKVLDNLDDAVEAGLKRSLKEKSSESVSGSGAETAWSSAAASVQRRKKRKSDEEGQGSSAGKKLFGMEDPDDGSSSSSTSSVSGDEEAEKAELEELQRIREELKENLAGLEVEEKQEEEEEEKEIEEEEEEDGEIVDGNKPVRKRRKVKVSDEVVSFVRNDVEIASTESANADGTTFPTSETVDDIPSSTVCESAASEHPADFSDVSTSAADVVVAPPSPKPLPPLPLNLEDYSSTEELAEFGLDFLKEALTEIGLKCGGTLEERAARLWSVRRKPKEEWAKSLFSKGKGKSSKN